MSDLRVDSGAPSVDGTRKDETVSVDTQVSYAMLDQLLWSRFQQAENADEYLTAWLGLLVRQVHGLASGVLVTSEIPDAGPYRAVAHWPAGAEVKPDLLEAAQEAVNTRRSVVLGEGTDRRILAHPLSAMDGLFGAVAVAAPQAAAATTNLFRRIQWGAGWIELMLLGEQEVKDGELRERLTVVFDILATLLERPRLDEAGQALVTELARRLNCETVSLGFRRGSRCRLQAISNTSGFGRRADLIRQIEVAMDEAVDQAAVILWPEPEGWEYRVNRANAELARAHGIGSVLTIPLVAGDEIIGAMTFERREGDDFEPVDVEVCDAVASIAGPIIEDRRVSSRMLPLSIWASLKRQLKLLVGPSHFGAKLATIALLGLVAFFSQATTDYSVSSPARLEGTVQRTIVAPFNGYLALQHARAGDIVQNNQILAVLDSKELALERLRLVTAQQQRYRELERAIARRKIAEANIIRAQIAQTDAQLELIDEQLARTRIRAPFSGYVVEGDLSQSVGASVERGQTLFKISPLEAFRVVLEIDERDISEIHIDQTGRLRLSALPVQPLEYRVNAITPLARQAGGRNFFRVEADILTSGAELRPGMEGIARTDIQERMLFWALTHDLADWARLWFWRVVP